MQTIGEVWLWLLRCLLRVESGCLCFGIRAELQGISLKVRWQRASEAFIRPCQRFCLRSNLIERMVAATLGIPAIQLRRPV